MAWLISATSDTLDKPLTTQAISATASGQRDTWSNESSSRVAGRFLREGDVFMEFTGVGITA